ncbi:ABC transporter permease [Saccharothrix hoggarensis]
MSGAVGVDGLRVAAGVRSCAGSGVPRGSVTGLLGPSGCGKTTVLRGRGRGAGGGVRHGHGARAPRGQPRAARPDRLLDAEPFGVRGPDRGGEPALLRVDLPRARTGTLGMALGLFAGAFARTEFQAVQFMPAIVMPQVLLCGLFVPRDGWRPCWTGSPTCCRCPTRSTR